jgi:small subunit ribosomal protein S13
MPRIAGLDLPTKKKVYIALCSLYGIGQSNVWDVLKMASVDGHKRVEELTSVEIGRIQKVIESNVEVEGSLRKKVRDAIERLKRIGTYRGMRHSRSLPVRGQRTRTNARTNRGSRHTVGALSKEAAAKLDVAKAPAK